MQESHHSSTVDTQYTLLDITLISWPQLCVTRQRHTCGYEKRCVEYNPAITMCLLYAIRTLFDVSVCCGSMVNMHGQQCLWLSRVSSAVWDVFLLILCIQLVHRAVLLLAHPTVKSSSCDNSQRPPRSVPYDRHLGASRASYSNIILVYGRYIDIRWTDAIAVFWSIH